MFKNVIAQDKAKKIISEQIKKNKIPHAYLFMGEDGIGKKTAAVEFAKILNCTINDYTKTDIGACNHCASCEMINKNSFPDLYFVNFDKQNEMAEKENEKNKQKLGIKLIREYMQKEVYLKAVFGKWKIFIIEPAEKLTTEAFNCLLKTLEEPPANTVIILVAKHKETVPITIVSRSQTIFFQPLPVNEISNYLRDKYSLTQENALKIANISDGSIKRAETLMLNAGNEYSSLWSDLTGGKMAVADILAKSRLSSKDRDSAIEAVSIITESAIKSFRRYPDKYFDIMQKLTESKKYLDQNVNPNTLMDNLFMYINSKIR